MRPQDYWISGPELAFVVPTWSCAVCSVLNIEHQTVPTLLRHADERTSDDDEMEDDIEHGGIYFNMDEPLFDEDDADDEVESDANEDLNELLAVLERCDVCDTEYDRIRYDRQ
jgi:hypothetical protein